MATLIERSEFTTPVYMIERTDPYTGGQFGTANKQAQQIANRTRYLLDRLLVEHELSGKHVLTERQIAAAAAIVEGKLNLDVDTATLYANILEAQEVLASVISALNSVQNLEDSKFKYIYTALLLSWRYGFPRFAFEIFTKNFTFWNGFKPVNVLETIAGDDSIDVADSSNVVVGDHYIIWDEETNTSTPVTVKKVLTNKRVILYADEKLSRASGVLTKMAWDIVNGVAVAKAGSTYVTAKLDLLTDYDRGNLVIAHYTDANFTVEYCRPYGQAPAVWTPIGQVSHGYSENLGMWRSVFETPGGEFFLRINCHTDTTIPHLALMSDVVTNLNTTVRTPNVADQDFTIVRFGAIYDAKHTGTIFELSKDTDFTSECTTLKFGAFNSKNPLWEYRDLILNQYPMAIGDDVYWRAKYTSSDGYQSRWSEIGHYIRETL